ncbi:iron-sulfur cluster repair di-iron protein [Niallia circulans]|uniref:iron-sulfur cluster repair di-iron protein n=1 Tax=Niallia circulans TaxID=1397 RepID=UPI0026F0CFC5|nr:iron-sulfur cluster repair di-iron protein [Niallia circulans]
MNAIFTEETKTGDIIIKFPAASKLFKEYKIDFCCGGNRPIGEAIKSLHLEDKDLVKVLNIMYEQMQTTEEIDWMNMPLTDLVRYIIDHYHANTRDLLEELDGFVSKVYRVHGARDLHLKDVYTQFYLLKDELEQHLLGEEQRIFPQVIEYEASREAEILEAARAEISILEEEHEGAGEILKKIRQATNDYELPLHACNTYRLTYLKLEELESLTFDHIHLENNVLFRRL